MQEDLQAGPIASGPPQRTRQAASALPGAVQVRHHYWGHCPSLTRAANSFLGEGAATPRTTKPAAHHGPFSRHEAPDGDDSTLGLIDFSICPHLSPDGERGNSMAEAEAWASGIAGPAYAIDDQTAITVVDGVVEVVSEGHWRRLITGSNAPPDVGAPH